MRGAQRGSPCPEMEALVWSAVSLAAGMENCGLEPAPGPPPSETTERAKKQTNKQRDRHTDISMVKSDRNIFELLDQVRANYGPGAMYGPLSFLM